MSPGLLKVVERAQREPAGRFNSLVPLIDVSALERAITKPTWKSNGQTKNSNPLSSRFHDHSLLFHPGCKFSLSLPYLVPVAPALVYSRP